jgi:hypothetical protein
MMKVFITYELVSSRTVRNKPAVYLWLEMQTRIAYVLLATIALAGCRTGRNYPDTTGPRYAGRPAAASAQSARGDTIQVVSFNTHTTTGGRWDHIFVKGLTAPVAAAGTVSRVRGASDHRPVWAIAVLRQQPTRRSLTSSTQNH